MRFIEIFYPKKMLLSHSPQVSHHSVFRLQAGVVVLCRLGFKLTISVDQMNINHGKVLNLNCEVGHKVNGIIPVFNIV